MSIRPHDHPDDHPRLAERLDSSFGAGPDLPSSLDDLLRRGHRARRRRQAAIGGVAALAVVAVASGALLVAPGGDRPSTGEYVGSPSALATATTAPTTGPSTDPSTGPTTSSDPTPTLDHDRARLLMQQAAHFGPRGKFNLAPGATLVDHIDNPYGLTAPAWSQAIAVEYQGVEIWYAESSPGDGSLGGQVDVAEPSLSFEQFVADQTPTGATTSFVGPDVWPEVVSYDAVRMQPGSETLTASDGFTIIDQRAHVDVGDAWAGAQDDTAAALVRSSGGADFFVLARRFDGKAPQYVVVPRAGVADDLTGFLAVARQRYASAR